MIKLNLRWIAIFIFIIQGLSWSQKAHAIKLGYVSYKVQEKDTVGKILNNLGVCPLWGKGNNVEKTIKLNSYSISKNGAFIRPNLTIYLPVENLAANQDYEINSNNEVAFMNSNPTEKCRSKPMVLKLQKKEIASVNLGSSEYQDEKPLILKKPTKKVTFGSLMAMTDFYFSALTVTDKESGAKAEIPSRLNRGIELAWLQYWDEINSTFLFFRSDQQQFEDAEGKLKDTSYNLFGFGVGYNRKINDKLSLRVLGQIQERLFTRATSVTTLVMDRVAVPEISIGPSYKLLEKNPFSLHADAGVAYLFNSKTSNYNVKSGRRYYMGLSLNQKIKSFNLSGRTYYGLEEQDSSITKKQNKTLGMSVSLQWNFDE
jgi:hypothetical protein